MKMKPSEVLFEAARVIATANHRGFQRYGCSVIREILFNAKEGDIVVYKNTFAYYHLMIPAEFRVDNQPPFWLNHYEGNAIKRKSVMKHRVIALLMAAQIAQSEGN